MRQTLLRIELKQMGKTYKNTTKYRPMKGTKSSRRPQKGLEQKIEKELRASKESYNEIELEYNDDDFEKFSKKR